MLLSSGGGGSFGGAWCIPFPGLHSICDFIPVLLAHILLTVLMIERVSWLRKGARTGRAAARPHGMQRPAHNSIRQAGVRLAMDGKFISMRPCILHL
jgi:hypothetical protein